MWRYWFAAVPAALLLATPAVSAGEGLDIARLAHLECLTPGPQERARISCPTDAFERKVGGIDDVELIFERPHEPPAMRLFDEEQVALALTYHMPFLANSAHELDVAAPARAPFLDWLSSVQFDLPEAAACAVYGTAMTLRIPCGHLDL